MERNRDRLELGISIFNHHQHNSQTPNADTQTIRRHVSFFSVSPSAHTITQTQANIETGAFAALVLIAGYLGLAPQTFELPGQVPQSDKFLHFFTFLLLTGTFYWVLDAARRRVLHLTLLVCTVGLGIGSEVAQGLLPVCPCQSSPTWVNQKYKNADTSPKNGRDFDIFDIAANTLGSLAALAACVWYHQRMLDRKRAAKYTAVPGDEETGGGGLPDPDEMELELEEQESGTIHAQTKGGAEATIYDELDGWDENAADDWDEEEQEPGTGQGLGQKQAGDMKSDPVEDVPVKKRVD